MATHKETCKSLVKERLAPHFPHVEERMKHFDTSYWLIKETQSGRPDPASLVMKRDGSMVWKASLPVKLVNVLVQEYPLDLAFTLLGIKPLTIIEHRQEKLFRKIHPGGLRVAGLEIGKVNDGQEKQEKVFVVYDPRITSKILSNFFNTRVEPTEIIPAIQESISNLEGMWFHQLLGYPEQLKTNRDGSWKISDFGLEVRSSGRIASTMPLYLTEGMSCATYSPEKINLEAFASAAAMVEEIRQSFLRIESYARILQAKASPKGKIVVINRETRIKRLENGEWDMRETEYEA
ncbi:MAG: hypothetical protein ABII22_06870 [Candidatus Micrarchaeota archaeon]